MIGAELSKALRYADSLDIGGRVYPEFLPQEATYPAITYQEISLFDEFVIDGDIGLDKSRFQIDVYANTYEEVRKLAYDVHQILKDYKSQTVYGVRRLSRNDLSRLEGDTIYRRVSLDYYITHKEI